MSLKRALEESLASFPDFTPVKDSSVKKNIPEHLKLGIYGENLACEFLEQKGYKITERNKRYRNGEIDIISQYDGDVVFVEVRTRRENPYMPADTTVGPEKIKRLMNAVNNWVTSNNYTGFYRIDLIAITVSENKPDSIEHIEGITEVMI